MDIEGLCLRLIRAETEEDVRGILSEARFWDDESVWRDYGDLKMNFSAIGNQQSMAEAALVEKLVNSIDALLLRECRRRNMNPEDPNIAPADIRAATERFFNVKRGTLSTLTSSERIKLGENILLVATGEKVNPKTGQKTNPSIMVIDNGEGQTPKRFPDTLVSLTRDNKVRIPFVQGKFNMGATGALQFCGPNGLQLIVSRRDQLIADQDPSDETRGDWGFTVVRRFRPREGMKTSVYRYLAPAGKVLRFSAPTLPALPAEYPNAYGTPMEWGTIVKLYEYNLSTKTNILLNAYFQLSLLLPEAALPIRIYERRPGWGGKGKERTLVGLTVQIEEAQSLEPGYPKSSAISVANVTLPCSIYVFKEDVDTPYLGSERVIFTINGQTHGSFEKAFLRRKSVDISEYIIDSVLIIVNCTGLPGDIREDLFMNSRDRLRYNEYRKEIEDRLAVMIRDQPDLKELGNKRRQERAAKGIDSSKTIEDMLEKLRKISPVVAMIMNEGEQRIHTPFDLTGVDKVDNWKGERFPSFFDLVTTSPRVVNSKHFYMLYKTDVVDDYFARNDSPGQFELEGADAQSIDFSYSLSSGTFRLRIDLPDDAQEGSIFSYKSKVTDVFHIESAEGTEGPFEAQFTIQVGKLADQSPGGESTHQGRSPERGTRDRGPSERAPPKVKDVYRADWPKYRFDDRSALLVIRAGEGKYDFNVNMDNIWLHQEYKTRYKMAPEAIKAQFRTALFVVGMAFVLKAESAEKEKPEQGGPIIDMIPGITEQLAPWLITMINDIADLAKY